MTSLEWYEVEKKLEEMKKLDELAARTPRSWGTPIEELYEKYYSLQMAAQEETIKTWDEVGGDREHERVLECLETEHRYRDVVLAIRREYPLTHVWASAHDIGMSH